MNKLIAVLVILAVFLSGCVGQAVDKVETQTPIVLPTAESVQQSEEFSHDLDQALDDLSQLE